MDNRSYGRDGGRGGNHRGDRSGGSYRGDRGGSYRGDRGGRDGGSGGYRGDRGGGGRGRRRGGPSRSEGRQYNPRDTAVTYHASSVPAPNTTVNNTENALEKSLAAGDLSALSSANHLPVRPGYGTRGIPVKLWANYIEITPPPKLTLHRYSIVITPSLSDIPKKAQRLIQLLLAEGKLSALGPSVCSDFKSTIITAEPLKDDMLQDTITYRGELEDDPPANPRGPINFKVTLDRNGVFSMGQVIDYLTSSRAGEILSSKDEFIQSMNILTGHNNKLNPNVLSIGASRHYRMTSEGNALHAWKDLGGGILAWRGFFMSVRLATGRLLMNISPKSAALVEHGPLLDVASRFAAGQSESTQKLAKFLEKVKIEVTHLKVKTNKAGTKIPRIKTISDLATTRDGFSEPQGQRPRVKMTGASPYDIEFFVKDATGSGQYQTVAKYFKDRYNIDCSRHPAVNVGTRDKPSYLPMEVCRVRMGQPAKAKLSGSQTTEMLNFAALRPHQNAELITQQGIDNLNLGSTNPTLSRFMLALANKEMITVPGRILTGPDVYYRAKKIAKTNGGSWNMRDIKFARSGKPRARWTVVWLDNGGQGNFNHQTFGQLRDGKLRTFHNALGTNGVDVESGEPKWIYQDSDRATRVIDQKTKVVIERTIQDKIGEAKNKTRADIVLVILSQADVSTYNAVKRAGDVIHGISTVCVVDDPRKFGTPSEGGKDLQYFANVALKFNLKLGGQNQVLDGAKLGVIDEGKTMVVGLDVTHPSPGSSETAPSAAGIVASTDKYLSQFPAALSVQTGRQEMIDDIGILLKSRLELWKKKNNQALPENILVYRDGVSEGQYDIVRLTELPAIQKACSEVYPTTQTKQGLPRMTVIIVGKRHHTRFYPTTDQPNLSDTRSGNPKNGTVVDRGVTEARTWDWFCQAHQGLQGTARPAHYVVVHDEIFRGRKLPPGMKNTADVLEDLTHNMCYMFGRATKAVSISPAAYYADLVCARARAYLSQYFDPMLDIADNASQSSGESKPHPGNIPEIKLHDDIKDTMYYI